MAMVLAMAIVTLSAMVMLLGMLVVMIMIVMVVIVVAMDDNAGNDAMVMMAMVGLLKISMLFNQHHVYSYRDHHHHHRRYHHRCGHHHHRDSQQHARLDLCRAAESFSLNQIFGSLIVHLSYSSPSQTSRSLSLTSRLRRSTAPLPA